MQNYEYHTESSFTGMGAVKYYSRHLVVTYGTRTASITHNITIRIAKHNGSSYSISNQTPKHYNSVIFTLFYFNSATFTLLYVKSTPTQHYNSKKIYTKWIVWVWHQNWCHIFVWCQLAPDLESHAS